MSLKGKLSYSKYPVTKFYNTKTSATCSAAIVTGRAARPPITGSTQSQIFCRAARVDFGAKIDRDKKSFEILFFR